MLGKNVAVGGSDVVSPKTDFDFDHLLAVLGLLRDSWLDIWQDRLQRYCVVELGMPSLSASKNALPAVARRSARLVSHLGKSP